MLKPLKAVTVAVLLCLGTGWAQQPTVLSAADAQKLVPQNYFYAGQTAPVQARNSAVAKSPGGKFVLAGMVDVSGYSSALAEKYQAFLITEGPLQVGGKPLGTGAYGIGTLANGDFIVTDLGGTTLFSVPLHADADLKRPVPLTMTVAGDSLRLYLGKKYVELRFGSGK